MSTVLNDRIRQRLETLGKTAAGASVEAGLGRTAIHNILSGASASPRLVTLQKLARVLGCSVDFLSGHTDDPADDKATTDRRKRMLGNPFTRVHILEANAFRPDDKAVLLDDMESLEFSDRRYPDHEVEIFVMNDDTGLDAAISQGDIVFCPREPTVEPSEIVLEDGMLVVSRWLVGGKNPLSELSLRKVSIQDDGIKLTCPSSDPSVPSIPISATAEYERLGEDRDPNVYRDPDDNFVMIVGRVIRIVRRI